MAQNTSWSQGPRNRGHVKYDSSSHERKMMLSKQVQSVAGTVLPARVQETTHSLIHKCPQEIIIVLLLLLPSAFFLLVLRLLLHVLLVLLCLLLPHYFAHQQNKQISRKQGGYAKPFSRARLLPKPSISLATWPYKTRFPKQFHCPVIFVNLSGDPPPEREKQQCSNSTTRKQGWAWAALQSAGTRNCPIFPLPTPHSPLPTHPPLPTKRNLGPPAVPELGGEALGKRQSGLQQGPLPQPSPETNRAPGPVDWFPICPQSVQIPHHPALGLKKFCNCQLIWRGFLVQVLSGPESVGGIVPGFDVVLPCLHVWGDERRKSRKRRIRH